MPAMTDAHEDAGSVGAHARQVGNGGRGAGDQHAEHRQDRPSLTDARRDEHIRAQGEEADGGMAHDAPTSLDDLEEGVRVRRVHLDLQERSARAA